MEELTTLFDVRSKAQSASAVGLTTGQKRCPRCQGGYVGPVNWQFVRAELIDKDAHDYADWVGGLNPPIVSERAMKDMQREGITGCKFHPIQITGVRSRFLAKKKQPKYFILEVAGRVDLNRQLFDEYDGDLCDICHVWAPREGGKHDFGEKLTLPDLKTWDGSDLVRTRNVKNSETYCTRQLVDLSREMQWIGLQPWPFNGIMFWKIDVESPTWFEEFEAAAKRAVIVGTSIECPSEAPPAPRARPARPAQRSPRTTPLAAVPYRDKPGRFSDDKELRDHQMQLLAIYREAVAPLIKEYPNHWFVPTPYVLRPGDVSANLDIICRKPCCLGKDNDSRHQFTVYFGMRKLSGEETSFDVAILWSQQTNPVPDDELGYADPPPGATFEMALETAYDNLEVLPKWVWWFSKLDKNHGLKHW